MKLAPDAYRAALLGLGLWFATTATTTAGDLKLSTIRVDLSDQQRSAALTLTNAGSEKTLIQIRVFAWSQKDGADFLDPTTEIIANPPMAEMAGGARQLLRVGYLRPRQTPSEQAYRLIVEEVPIADAVETPGIHTYLKISVPIFIAETQKSAPLLDASWARSPAGLPVLLIGNPQTQHVRITKYWLTGAAREVDGLHYVLAGSQIALPAAGVAGVPSSVKLTTTDGVIELPVKASQQ